MKHTKVMIAVAFTMIAIHAKAQWLFNGTHIHNSNSGNVGINNTAPGQKLSVVSANSTSTTNIAGFLSSNRTQGVGIGFNAIRSIGTNADVNLNFYTKGLGYFTFNVGNVGINISAPASKLSIKSDDNNDATDIATFISNDGTLGIGVGRNTIRALGSNNADLFLKSKGSSNIQFHTNAINQVQINSTGDLELFGNNNGTSSNGFLRFGFASGEGIASKRTTGGNRYGLDFYTSNANRMCITNGGNVGIGTLTPAYKLDVCGTIRGKEVRVETGWCDYVFDKDYKLRSLDEVENYIKNNKHLPGVAPASEVEKEGLNVGEMNKVMMEKIEELTLYVIQLSKENKKISEDNDDLRKLVIGLKK